MQLINGEDEDIPPQVLRTTAQAWAMNFMAKVMAFYCVGQGVTIIVGGPMRFSGASYSVADGLPGSPYTWGTALIIVGVISWFGIIARKDTIATIGMIGAGIWAASFAFTFARAAYLYDQANTTAVWAYGLQCVLFITAGVAYHSSHPRKMKK